MQKASAIVLLLVLMCGQAVAAPPQANYNVCEQSDLMHALAYIYYACRTVCDEATVRQLDSGAIDRSTLLGILGSNRLTVRHIFFPLGENNVEHSLDWDIQGEGSRQDQLRSLKLAVDSGGMLFILGKASVVQFRNGRKTNVQLSQERVASVQNYLERLGIDCSKAKRGGFGEKAFQFNEADAARLGIRDYEYGYPAREDFDKLGAAAYREAQRKALYTLNQAVHVIFVPCPPDSLLKYHRELVWFHHRAAQRQPVGSDARRQHETIRRVLYSEDESFAEDLCSFCLGGDRPAGTPPDASRQEACVLASQLRVDHRPCTPIKRK